MVLHHRNVSSSQGAEEPAATGPAGPEAYASEAVSEQPQQTLLERGKEAMLQVPEMVVAARASVVAWWKRTTDHVGLLEDSRRRSRYLSIILFALVYSAKIFPNVLPKLTNLEIGFHIVNIICLVVLAYFAHRNPGSMKIDVAFAITMYWCFKTVTDFYSQSELMTPLSQGSELIAAFSYMQHLLISSGTHQSVTLVWHVLVWFTCWRSDEVPPHHSMLFLAFQAHTIHFIFLQEETQKRAEKQAAEQHKHELKQAKAEKQRWHIEQSLNIVLHQLKSPLLLLVSDLKNSDATPEEAQDQIRMLAARVSQIWNLFTGLELKVNEAMRDYARARDSSTPSTTGPGRRTSPGASVGSPPGETPTIANDGLDAVQAGLQAGLTAASAPRSQRSGRSFSYACSSNSSGSSRRSQRRTALPSIGDVRVVFDALHLRAEMKEIIIRFPENKERVGLLDWVRKDQVGKFKDWVQDLTNKAVQEQMGGASAAPLDATTKDVCFNLPGAGNSTFIEAANVALRSLACKFSQPEPARAESRSASKQPQETRETSGKASKEQEGEVEEEAEGEEEEEDESEEDESSEEEDEDEVGELEGVEGIVEFKGLSLLMAKERESSSRARAMPSTLGRIGETHDGEEES